jgi:hypothetical protein
MAIADGKKKLRHNKEEIYNYGGGEYEPKNSGICN